MRRRSVLLPRRHAKCTRCSGQIRASIRDKDYWLICDDCNLAGLAPSNLHALIEDLLNANHERPLDARR